MNPESFLPNKYPDLPGSKPVERAVAKAKHDPERTFAPHSREERIQAYLNRIDTIVEDERGWELLKNKITKEFVIDTDDGNTLAKIASGLYESEKRIAIEQGRGGDVQRIDQNEDLVEKYKGLVEEKRDIQERTLDSWLDYLKQNDAHYPIWFRYFVVRNLGKMGTLDKEKGEYTKRTDYTVAPFPEINSEALGFVYRMLTTGIGHQEFTDAPEKRDELEKLITKKDFIRLYTFAQIETAGNLNRESLQGEWVKYDQGSDHHVLEDVLRGKGTGWCTAEGSAYSHLQGGDFHVYFTRGTSGTYSEPRIAIRMEGDHVGEVRGVNHRQELEPALIDIATEKYHALPGGEKFDKQSADMKRVTILAKKQEKGEPFDSADLRFLYELNALIEGFGYQKDPRIEELRGTRNQKEDLPVLFDCAPDQVAYGTTDVNENTKVYIGAWTPEVMDILPEGVTDVYEKFPDKKIFMRTVETDPTIKSADDAIKKLEAEGYRVGDWAKGMLKKVTRSGEKQSFDLASFSVSALGFPGNATYADILKKAKELGLDLVPEEAGPAIRRAYPDQSIGDYLRVAMNPITVADGNPRLWYVSLGDDGRWLGGSNGRAAYVWDGDYRFVFLRRKSLAV